MVVLQRYVPAPKWGRPILDGAPVEIRELIDREHLDVLQVSGVSMLPPRLEGAISFDSCATKRSARDQLIVNIFI